MYLPKGLHSRFDLHAKNLDQKPGDKRTEGMEGYVHYE